MTHSCVVVVIVVVVVFQKVMFDHEIANVQELMTHSCVVVVVFQKVVCDHEIANVQKLMTHSCAVVVFQKVVFDHEIAKVQKLMTHSCAVVVFQKVVCDHEIANIFCACQDGEHMNFFAYITKDKQAGMHYCHVFSVRSRVSPGLRYIKKKKNNKFKPKRRQLKLFSRPATIERFFSYFSHSVFLIKKTPDRASIQKLNRFNAVSIGISILDL